jgi:ELWxxDGT repeat protein
MLAVINDFPTGSVQDGGPVGYFQVGDIAYFNGRDMAHGFTLWRTDGTTAGTYRVYDHSAGSPLAIDQTLYFRSSDGVQPVQLYTLGPSFADLNGRTLTVNAGLGSDTLVFADATSAQRAPALSVTFEGETRTFNLADFDEVVINPGDGDDLIQFNATGATIIRMDSAGGSKRLEVNAGIVRLANDAGVGAAGVTVDVAAGATVEFAATQHLQALNVAGGAVLVAGANVALVTASLNVTGSGFLDVNDNRFVVDYAGATPVSAVRAMLQTGYANGAWNGPGIRSSSAAGAPGTAIGFGEAIELFDTFPANFFGEQVDQTTIIARYTLAGDATLDGSVNLVDFNRLASNFGQSGRDFAQGDFNYDGNVDLTDFNVLAGRFGTSLAPAATPFASFGPHRKLIDELN